MEWILFYLLLGLFWVVMSRTSGLWKAVRRLESQMAELDRRVTQLIRDSVAAEPPTETAAPAKPVPPPPTPTPAAPTAWAAAPPPQPGPAPATPREPYSPVPLPARPPDEPGFIALLFDNMRHNWMAWIGGVSVALAGIFLVGYSIEMGYLGPTARIVLAVVGGLVLHAAAEYFRRRTGTAHPAFAMLAGGASITLYAAFIAALKLYGLLGVGTTFVLLAIVSLATMALATVHGPLLAGLGILGAYVVPVLVANDSREILIDLGYSLIITTAALFLIRFVYRPWLWYGMLAGALAWWLVSLPASDADGLRGIYLAAFAYLALAVPTFDWALNRKPREGDPGTETIGAGSPLELQTILLTLLLVVLAEAVSIWHLGFTGLWSGLLEWSPLTIVVLIVSRARPALAPMLWALALTQLGAWLLAAIDTPGAGFRLEQSLQGEFLAYAIATALLFSVGRSLARRGQPFSHADAALIWLGPVLWIALAYLLVTDLSASWDWAVATLLLGLVYIAIAGRRLQREQFDRSVVWLILGGHFAYSLAVAMMFREATLTLALAAQLISLAWLRRRFALPSLDWLIKGVLAAVVARLTFNPWLLTYSADVHWSFWTYGGAFACGLVASRISRDQLAIRKWLEAATLHLLVLFLAAETRYWLYDGQVFFGGFTLREAAIDTALWGGLCLSYFNLSRRNAPLAQLYLVCSRVLGVLALSSYALALTVLNPLFAPEQVAATPIWNLMLLAYGVPVLIAAAAWFVHEPRFRDLAAAIAGGGFFIFISLEIRHLWHGALDLRLGLLNGEIYTYSAVWLAMAVATMLTATRLGLRNGYRIGIGLLFLVIAKIFVYDMAGLEGLLRVASFFGLGLALLGLAWLYQRTARRPDEPANRSE